ncbi:hypothetical protein CCZ01_01590 [Helicobacter monodelphidis]|uniref:DUF1090 family protein n=1 Tax=Helicobacter sp. 15-1451 TaxID=2004995 RepID=UPI000DCB9045|nr:DUF1090 family protein [Helicobacter sp. 15-1451]RAX58914.1 hypothetical protein CCZ01_01590 [Helicobacter sp. 15-1451]
MKMFRLLFIFLLGGAFVFAGAICNHKRTLLNKKLEFAKEIQNAQMEREIKIALSSVEHFCSDEKVLQDLQDKISKVESKIAENQEDIEEAKAKGKIDKVKKESFKVSKLQAELEELKVELAEYEKLK